MPKTEFGSAVLNSVIDAPYHALDVTAVGERFDTANLLPNHQLHGKTAVFVDCRFWHGCPIHGTKPKNNAAF